MKINLSLFLTLFVSIVFGQTNTIKLNQIGFYPQAQKFAIAPTNSTLFEVVNKATSQAVFSGNLSSSSTWEPSGETVKLADFSDFNEKGSFYLKIAGLPNSSTFKIKENVHQKVLKGVLKAYYYNRASTSLTATFAGEYARPLGHPDTKVYIHPSAASPGRPAGSTISSPKGWYDAGDYGKYIVNSGISTYTVLALYEHFPEYFKTLEHNIPESGNDIPDVLEEAKWNLDWMLTMQDPADGGVYHKLTTSYFTGDDMPHEATEKRYVVMKGTAATLDFAAVMAQASRIFADYEADFPGYAAQCLVAAENAWDWAIANPNKKYVQPVDIHTGEYGDSNFGDEFDWAAAELYITTANNDYYTATNLISSDISTPGWSYVAGLTWVSLGHNLDKLTAIANKNTIRNKIIDFADDLIDQYNNSAYRFTTKDFYWGSNSTVGNEGLMLIQAFKLTNDTTYLNVALSNLDYILGRNATGFSFVTGFGNKSPMNIHHRQSRSDYVVAPVPGWVAGGPNPGQQDNDDGNCDYYTSSLPALSYIDEWCSYASNEVTINWNAPIAYLAAAAEVYLGDSGVINSLSGSVVAKTNVFPTVSSKGFYIDSDNEVNYSILDLNGRLVNSSITKRGQLIGAELPQGMYLIQIIGNQNTEVVRVIKE